MLLTTKLFAGQTIVRHAVSQQVPTVKVNGSPVTPVSSGPGFIVLPSAAVKGDEVELDFEPAGNGRDYLMKRSGLNQASGNQDFVVPFDDCTDHQISVDTNGSISAGSVALWGLPLGKTTYETVFNLNGTPAAISFTLTGATQKARFSGRYSAFRLVPTGITGAGTYSANLSGWSQGNSY